MVTKGRHGLLPMDRALDWPLRVRLWAISGRRSPDLSDTLLVTIRPAQSRGGVQEEAHGAAIGAGRAALSAASAAPVLEFCGLAKRFGGTLAVDGLDLALHPGEILALLGQNGAGKSTLIKMLAGVHAPDSGEIRLNGAAYDPRF